MELLSEEPEQEQLHLEQLWLSLRRIQLLYFVYQ